MAGVRSSGWVTASEPALVGRSTRRREPVSFLGLAGSGFPSGPRGRPGAAITPDLGFDSSTEPTGRGGGVLRGGCGATGSGAGGREMLVPVSGGALGGVVNVPDSVRLNVGSGCVMGREGGRDWWEMGSRSGGISTRPLFTKTLACGFATITRGG